MSKKMFVVTLKKSMIGCSKRHRDTVRCLGLKRIRQSVEISDNPASRGLIYAVQHLIDVEVKR
ncbi:MAG: 50S ribosomal protein L30 [Bdellovibrionales bacterium]|nr:50S ribosomal protein L30 [Bdellovibrionales bacterium]MBL7669472.1 50S ribosomal protein L30 [Pseudobdellovibrionaceae bacterium]